MEGIKAEVKLGELKRENLRKSLEQVRAQASSVLVFTLQWKELENHFDLVQHNIEKRVEVVELQEKELETEMRVLRERQEEIGLKESELSLWDKKIEECNAELKLKQEDLDLVRKLVGGCSKELSLKKEQLCSVQRLVSECCEKLEGKEKQLGFVEKQIQKSSKEIDVKNEKLDSLQLLVEECEGKLELKETELGLVTRRVDEKSRELELKEKELECLRNSIQECCNQLDMKQKELVRSQEMIADHCKQNYEEEKALDSLKSLIRDCTKALEAKGKKHDALVKSVRYYAAKLESKEKELGLIEEAIMDRSAELHSREIEFDSLQTLIRRSEKQLESTKKELDSVQASVGRYSKDFELKRQEFNAIQMCNEECRQELRLKEKQLSSVQISIQGCSKQLKAEEEERISIKNSILECPNELESKQQHLKAIPKSQEQLSDVLESKEKQLDLVEKACSARLLEVKVKEKHLGSLKRSLEEPLEKLETEKRQLEARVKEIELKEKQFDSVQEAVEQQSKGLELKEKQLTDALHSQVRSENPSSSFFQVHGITKTETVNPITPNQIKTEQPEHFMISNANDTSSTDLGVLATMDGRSLQGIPTEYLDEPDLRQNEVLAALQMSPDPAKFVLDLMLGTCSQHQKKGGTGFKESVLKIYVLMLEQLLQVSPLVQPNVKADALKLAIEWKAKMKLSAENSIEIMGFLQFVAAFGLVSSFNRDEIFKLLGTSAQHQQARNVCQILGFTDMIPDFVGSLIERKQYIEAVRFAYAFDSKDKCPPELLLNQFWEDISRVARDSCKMGKPEEPFLLEKATDQHITALKSVIERIKVCKLEFSMPVKLIEKCIAELEKQKMNSRFSAPAPAPPVRSKVQGWTNCNTGPSIPRNQCSPVPAQNKRGTNCNTGPSIPRNQRSPVPARNKRGICASTPGTQLQGMNRRFSAPTPAPPARSKVQGRTNCNTGPSIPRNQCSPVPARNKRGICASTPGSQLQGLSNKRARNYGPVNKLYNRQVATVNYPYNRFASQHGLGVPLNQGVARFGRPAKLVL